MIGLTGSLTAANQNEWLKYIDQRLAEKYPGIKRIANRPCDGSPCDTGVPAAPAAAG